MSAGMWVLLALSFLIGLFSVVFVVAFLADLDEARNKNTDTQ